jgi:hypothetical protein
VAVKKHKWSCRITIVVILLAVAIGLAWSWSARELSFRRRQFSIEERVCRDRFAAVARELRIYASENDGRYPDQLALLTNDVFDLHRALVLFRCPLRKEPDTPNPDGALRTDFIYVSGLSTNNPPRTVLMYCPPKNHYGRSATILYVDDTVETCDPKRFERLVPQGNRDSR